MLYSTIHLFHISMYILLRSILLRYCFSNQYPSLHIRQHAVQPWHIKVACAANEVSVIGVGPSCSVNVRTFIIALEIDVFSISGHCACRPAANWYMYVAIALLSWTLAVAKYQASESSFNRKKK